MSKSTNHANHAHETDAPTASQTVGGREYLGCLAELARLADTHPDWYARYEDSDTDVCSKLELMELIATAPSPVARAYLCGKVSLRDAIASITGRPY